MIRDLLKWVAPGAVTVLGSTIAALAMATPAMLETLEQEGRAALRSAGSEWAHIALSGRRIHLTGTTSSDTERDQAMASLLALDGIYGVDETVTVAPLAHPYRINVAVEDGAINLFGSVPNETLRQQFLALDNVSSVDLQIRSGQPDEALWHDGVDFALAQAALVETGYFELSGLTLNAVGRASSEKALGRLQMALADIPEGIALGEIDVEPVRVAPYTWRAEFDGNRIAISGHVPEERVADRLRLADVSGIPIATGLSLASGAPEGFTEQTRLLVEQLARLERGEARITDGVSLLVGVPPSVEVAQAVTEALSGTNSIVELSPPRIADYWVSINRQPGGTLVFDGYVPDEMTRSDFSQLAGADVSFLKFGAGAPETYRRAVDFGLELLGHLSEGRYSVSGEAVSISGIALSPTDYRSVQDLVAAGLPQGVTLANMTVEAPRAAAYKFTARREAGGDVVLEGMLPDPQAEMSLLTKLGARATSRVSYASGEASDFLASAEQAIAFLPWLRSGTVSYDGAGWLIQGEPLSAIDKASIETEFAIRGLARAGWALALSAPVETPVVADPYLWSAERLSDGSFLFAGHVPSAAMQSYLKVHAGTRVADTTRVSHGAPEGFVAAARAAVDALLVLEQGSATFDGTAWTLSGAAATPSERDAALGLVTGLALAGRAEISVPEAPPAAPYVWTASRSAGSVTFTGSVPAESLQRFLAVRAGAEVDDRTELRSDAPEGFASDVLQAMDVLALLSQGQVGFDGSRWMANGVALAPDANAAATTLLGTSAPRWTLALTDPAPEPDGPEALPEVASADAMTAVDPPPAEQMAPVAAAPPPPAASFAQCQARLAELSAHNAILFQSGAAIIAAGASTELDAFAQALLLCPDAAVEVEGHTDSDGDDRLNLALSVARAEAVVTALIERGVSPARLYAIGYGETRPIADNASADGKRRNRRIVISIRDAGSED